jgi:hypothetical protein
MWPVYFDEGRACPASFMMFFIIGDRGFKDTLLWGQGLGKIHVQLSCWRRSLIRFLQQLQEPFGVA